jgi:hypothetical protein
VVLGPTAPRSDKRSHADCQLPRYYDNGRCGPIPAVPCLADSGRAGLDAPYLSLARSPQVRLTPRIKFAAPPASS